MILITGRDGNFSKEGFTLIELIGVIAVILILFSITAGGMKAIKQYSAKQKARTEIYSLSAALKAYELDYGGYPADGIANMTKALLSKSKNGPYIEKSKWNIDAANKIIDPWGKSYVYHNNIDGSMWAGVRNSDSFDLYSCGPNRIDNNGKVDDIGNWK